MNGLAAPNKPPKSDRKSKVLYTRLKNFFLLRFISYVIAFCILLRCGINRVGIRTYLNPLSYWLNKPPTFQ